MEIIKNSENGNLIISQEALSSIAINAAKDVDGVGSFSNKPFDMVSTIKKGSLKVMSPVRITQNGDSMDVSIYINLLPNKKIKTVSENIQSSVREAIENMTGKKVDKVNVIIAGIDFPESGDSKAPLTSEE
ncbi:Asp23/Gls24 family envelope stress response protein [uncultured Eubacterium sp.]|uniref:Asp23/Gls24 family envelope stress response protein n=1 Tax=uncultured Eubacterium sp. TaxID=165185 RepID=UPI0015ABB262|nr:Asp23/Gls24 family envelope stress response protein [uncultured Eubacterium sp.]